MVSNLVESRPVEASVFILLQAEVLIQDRLMVPVRDVVVYIGDGVMTAKMLVLEWATGSNIVPLNGADLG